RLLLAHQPGQVGRAEARVDAPDPRPHLAEAGRLRGDGEVTHDVEDVPAADRVAVHRRDDRLRDVTDRLMEILHVEADFRAGPDALVASLAAARLIAAGAEGPVAGPGQDYGADRAVGPRVAQRVRQLVDRLGAEGVQYLRAVDREGRDALCLLVQD